MDNIGNINRFTGVNQPSKATTPKEVKNVGSNLQINFQNVNALGREDLDLTLSGLTNKAKINSPVAQGLASAQDIQNKQLVSGYYFTEPLNCDNKLFAIKYDTANVPNITKATNQGCDNIEYVAVSANIQNPNGPFADLFT